MSTRDARDPNLSGSWVHLGSRHSQHSLIKFQLKLVKLRIKTELQKIKLQIWNRRFFRLFRSAPNFEAIFSILVYQLISLSLHS